MGFAFSNTTVVMTGTALLGLACGTLGSFAVFRRRALVGDALAHAALPGVCTAYLITRERAFFPLFIGAMCFGLLAVWLISFIRNQTRIKEDAAIAISLSSLFGLGIVLSRLIQNLPSGNRSGLDEFIFGKAASMVQHDVIVIASATAVSVFILLLIFKELKLLCFDKEYAASIGLPVFILDYLLMVLLCICAVVGLPAVGAVLVSALLIFPGVTARLWSNRLEVVVPLAGLFGLISAIIGTALSSELIPLQLEILSSQPTGPLIVVSCGIFFALSLLLSPVRGLFSRRVG